MTASALARRLRQDRTDVPRQPIPSLGFSFGARAGAINGASANLSVHCGSYEPASSNYAILSITCEGSWSGVTGPVIRALLDVLVETWDPERDTAGFGLFHELPPEPDLDWIMYLDGRHRPPSMPEPTTVEPLPEGRGSIITLAPVAPDLRRPDDAGLVEDIRQTLLAVAPLTT